MNFFSNDAQNFNPEVYSKRKRILIHFKQRTQKFKFKLKSNNE